MAPILLELAFLVGTLVIFIYLQRAFHLTFQSILLIITRDKAVTVSIFALIFLPGVIVHELSHFLMAKILRVRTGKISLLPKIIDEKKLQLGYVEIYPADWLRDSLIGLAPFLSGSALIYFLSTHFLQFTLFSPIELTGLWYNIVPFAKSLAGTNDALLWIYLLFTISTTMMPSDSDRSAWTPMIVLIALTIAAAFGLGFGDQLARTFETPLTLSIQFITFNLLISLFLHLIAVISLQIARFFLIKILQFTYTK